jgi:Uma2 family endonuclease
MAIALRGLTLEEFLRRPERKPALEFEDGVVTQKVAPKGQHSTLQWTVAHWFNSVAKPRKLALALPELRTTYAGASYVPDVAVYRWERIPRDAAGRIADDFFEPPDIAVEIVSPRQSVNALVRRCLWYVAHGVQIALLVDARDESIVDFRPNQPARALRGADRVDFAPVLPGMELVVQELFGALLLDR